MYPARGRHPPARPIRRAAATPAPTSCRRARVRLHRRLPCDDARERRGATASIVPAVTNRFSTTRRQSAQVPADAVGRTQAHGRQWRRAGPCSLECYARPPAPRRHADHLVWAWHARAMHCSRRTRARLHGARNPSASSAHRLGRSPGDLRQRPRDDTITAPPHGFEHRQAKLLRTTAVPASTRPHEIDLRAVTT